MSLFSRRYYLPMIAILLSTGMLGCVPSSKPDYGASGFDALGGIGQRLTDAMVAQTSHFRVHTSQRLSQESPIQMTEFVSLDGSTAGKRFGGMIAERMAQRFTQKGYIITRATPPNRLLPATFPRGTKPDNQL